MNYMEQQRFMDDLFDEALRAVDPPGNTRQAALYVQAEVDRLGLDLDWLAAWRGNWEVNGLRDAVAGRAKKVRIVASTGVSVQKFQSVTPPGEVEQRYVDIELFDADQLEQLAERTGREGRAKVAVERFYLQAVAVMRREGLATAGEAFTALGAVVAEAEEAA